MDTSQVRHVAVAEASPHRDDMEFVSQCWDAVAVLMRRDWEAMQQKDVISH
jgi:hypothetical protein